MATGGSNRTRLYTRTGDHGETALAGGTRVAKHSPRIQTYGSFDELGAHLGVAEAALPAGEPELQALLVRLQHELYLLQSELALPANRPPPERRIQSRHVEELEREIDRYTGMAGPLKSFILPRGTPAGAALHVARTVARRAERELTALNEAEPQREDLLQWVNRLSDLLFAVSLVVNRRAGFHEIPPDYSI